jgi:hypothetical protein
VDKQYILEEIRRTTIENDGKPLGHRKFENETGIKYHDWLGKYWARWGDALKEAGFTPNKLTSAFTEDFILEKLCGLIRELGYFPSAADRRLKRNKDKTFPADGVFERIGNQRTLKLKVVSYCKQRGIEDVIKLFQIPESGEEKKKINTTIEIVGTVYLIKSGKFYKIGRTNSLGRREYEISLQLPEKEKLIHSIKTDDPVGIEKYWHDRFDKFRANGEWFSLTLEEVNAFKRRKFM